MHVWDKRSVESSAGLLVALCTRHGHAQRVWHCSYSDKKDLRYRSPRVVFLKLCGTLFVHLRRHLGPSQVPPQTGFTSRRVAPERTAATVLDGTGVLPVFWHGPLHSQTRHRHTLLQEGVAVGQFTSRAVGGFPMKRTQKRVPKVVPPRNSSRSALGRSKSELVRGFGLILAVITWLAGTVGVAYHVRSVSVTVQQ